jgi:Ni/Fe-hydrogenase 1 B-type cytochrome subunit
MLAKPSSRFWSLTRSGKQRHSPAVRLLHWIYAPALIVGALSGFYITCPRRRSGFKNMDSARKTHFISMYFLAFAYLARVYYGWITGSQRDIIPRKQDIASAPRFLKYELFLNKNKPESHKYNPLKMLEFCVLALLIPVQAVTGLALYKPGSGWRTPLETSGLNRLRKAHYLTALGIASLAAQHIYFALTDDLKILKSIFTTDD